MADRTISVDFIARNDKFVSPVDQMNKQLSKMDTVASYAKKSLITLGIAAAALGIAFLLPQKYMQGLVNVVTAGFAKMAAAASAGAAFISSKISSALGTGLGTILKSQLAGLITIPLAHMAIAAAATVAGGLAVATKSAIDFDAQMRNTNTILGLNESQFRKTSQAVLDLSMKYPIAANDLAQALYRIGSAGFLKAADAAMVLDKAALASVAGVTDVATAGNAVVTVLNAYGLSAKDAGHVTDVLFQSVKQGQFTFPEMAGQVSDFSALAHAAGVSLEETFAAYSMVSVKMGDAAQSSTALRGIFTALIKPSAELSNVTRAMGFESSTAMLKQLGLVGTVKALNASVNGSVDAMAALFPEVRGLNGALAIATTNGEQAQRTLDNFTDSSKLSGAAQRAFDEQSKSAAKSLKALINNVKTIGIEIGMSLVPVVKLAVTFLGNLLKIWQDLPGPIKQFSGVILAAWAGLTVFGSVAKLVSTNTALLKLTLQKLGDGSTVGGIKNVATKIGDITHSSGLAARGVGLLKTAFSGIAAAAGPLALIYTILTAGASLNDSIKKQSTHVKQLAADLLDVANNAKNAGGVLNAAKGWTYQGGFGGLMRDIGDLANTDTRKIRASLENVDQALAVMVKSGNAPAAAKALDMIRGALTDAGRTKDLAYLNAHIDAYSHALKESTADSKLAAAAQDSASQSVDQMASKYNGLGQALADVDKNLVAMKAESDALGTFHKNLMSAIGGIGSAPSDALNKIVSDQQAAVKDASKDAKAAQKDLFAVESAQLGVARAVYARVDAEKALHDAQAKDFAYEIMKAERSIQQAYSDSVRAIIRLEDATKALEELRHPTGRSVVEAEIALGRAHDAQAAAIDNVVKAQDQLNQARDHGTPAEIALSERNLRDATWGVQDATFALADAQKKYNDLTQNTPDRQKAIQNATLDVADANRAVANQQDTVRDSLKALADLRDQQKDQPNVIARAELALKEAVLAVKQADESLAKALAGPEAQAAADTFSKQQSTMEVSAEQFRQELEKQIQEHHDYWDNILKIAERYGPGVAAEFLKLGIGATGIVSDMAHNVNQSTQKLADDMIKNSIYGTETFQKIMDANMSRTPGTVRTYTSQAAKALAEELKIGVDKAEELLNGFGLKLQDTTSSYMKEISPGSFRQYTPGKGFSGPTFQAEGDVINGHEPQIGNGMRVWAEPETGGEAYIPLSPTKRKRSEKLLQHVAGIFGMHAFADGGVLPPAANFDQLLAQGLSARVATPTARGEHSMYDSYRRFLDNWVPSSGQMGLGSGNAVVDVAKTFMGVPYLWGGGRGSEADARTFGVDCSGLIIQTFRKIPGSPDMMGNTLTQQYKGHAVPSITAAVPGDLLFFGNTPNATDPHHVGIYASPHVMIDAPHTGSFVRAEDYEGFGSISVIRRILELVPSGGAANGSAVAIGQRMAAARGWLGPQWDALYALWNGESGWDPLAHNASSGAHGIPQALPGNKMAAFGADWYNNPTTQIAWGDDYIAGRYGTPSNAYGQWLNRSPHWYGQGGVLMDGGGWLPPHSRTMAVNNTNRWEPVGPPGGGGMTFTIPVKVDARVAANVDLDQASRVIGEQVKQGVEEALNKVERKMLARNGR